MCGFICIVNEKNFNRKLLSLSNNDKYNHRGPDNSNLLIEKNFSTLFRRLKIIDLSDKSNQPIISEDKRYILLFNGEIYNYVELKEKLKKENYRFHSKGDAEVLLKSYLHWGDSFTNKLDGMFAICIWDRKKKFSVFLEINLVKNLFIITKLKKVLLLHLK